MVKYLRCATSGAAGDKLGTMIKYLRGVTGSGLGATIQYMGRSTNGSAGDGRVQRPITCDAQRAAPRALA
jgi:hypothetical protein